MNSDPDPRRVPTVCNCCKQVSASLTHICPPMLLWPTAVVKTAVTVCAVITIGCLAPSTPPIVTPPALPALSAADTSDCDASFPPATASALSPLCYAIKFVRLADVAAGGESKPSAQKAVYLTIAAEADDAKAKIQGADWVDARAQLNNLIGACGALPSTLTLQAAAAQLRRALAALPPSV